MYNGCISLNRLPYIKTPEKVQSNENILDLNPDPIVTESVYNVDWSKLSYNTYWYNQNEDDMLTHFYVTTTSNSITFSPKSIDTERRSYVSNVLYNITEDTEYEYIFQVKNTCDYRYCGVVFAFAEGLPYFIYGSFNNGGDPPNEGKCDIRIYKGLNYHENSERFKCETGYERSFITADLDADGYGTFKLVINGYNVTVYVLTDANNEIYTLIGNTITLPLDAKLAIGAYNREGYGDNEIRTVSIKNTSIYARNEITANEFGDIAEPISVRYPENPIFVNIKHNSFSKMFTNCLQIKVVQKDEYIEDSKNKIISIKNYNDFYTNKYILPILNDQDYIDMFKGTSGYYQSGKSGAILFTTNPIVL